MRKTKLSTNLVLGFGVVLAIALALGIMAGFTMPKHNRAHSLAQGLSPGRTSTPARRNGHAPKIQDLLTHASEGHRSNSPSLGQPVRPNNFNDF
jgi:hypothetical protein